MKVRILDRNGDGRGRGRLGSKTALISQAHPGEEVSFRLDRKTRGTLQGRVRRLITADPHRIHHRCSHEFVCTGCPLLAAPEADEASFKINRVREALVKSAGSLATPLDLQPSLTEMKTPCGPFHYRHYTKQVAIAAGRRLIFGSYVAGTHEVASNSGCPVLAPELMALVRRIRRDCEASGLSVADPGREDSPEGLRYVVARQSRATGEQLLLLVTSRQPCDPELTLCRRWVDDMPALVGAHVLINRDSGNALLRGELTLGAGAEFVTETLAGESHRIGPRSFFQINPEAAEVLAQEVLEGAGEGAVCLEGYAGVGALTLPLARRFRHVQAVESSAEALGHLEASAAAAGLGDRIEAQQGRAEEVLPRWLSEAQPSAPPDAVVLDPPRRGLGAPLSAALAAAKVPRIVLLSCDPSTLAHDLPPLLEAGYRIRRVTPINQFPRTAHVETVTVLASEPAS